MENADFHPPLAPHLPTIPTPTPHSPRVGPSEVQGTCDPLWSVGAVGGKVGDGEPQFPPIPRPTPPHHPHFTPHSPRVGPSEVQGTRDPLWSVGAVGVKVGDGERRFPP